MTTLHPANIAWAIEHVVNEGDTDVFPRPFELDFVANNRARIAAELGNVHIEGHEWEGHRRAVIPRGGYAFRTACQLDPYDAILYAAIVKEISPKIEAARAGYDAVFSYRLSGDTTHGQFYLNDTGWDAFWGHSKDLAETGTHVLVTDISDFYNQISHHTIENQFDKCGVAPRYKDAVMRLLKQVSNTVSRGVPIGPHPSHLIAEMSLIGLDNFIGSLNLPFCRYVDDIHIFCPTELRAHEALYELVGFLDQSQKLVPARSKTDITLTEKFVAMAAAKATDDPISPLEEELLEAIGKHTDSPYQLVGITELSEEELEMFSDDNIEQVLTAYVEADDLDFVRLRWFIRRLTQVGTPGAIPFLVQNFEELLPASSEIARYLEAAAPNFTGTWKDIGSDIVKVLQSKVVQANEYLRTVILGLFSTIEGINHINELTSVYKASSPMCQRKILLAAAAAGQSDWLGNLRSEYKTGDVWLRRALLYSMRVLPDDQRTHWRKPALATYRTGMERLILEAIA